MQAGDASGTALLDTAAREWDLAAMRMIDPHLPDLFPALIGPDEASSLAA
jgi:sugar (pentulose or hexulose) kinase